jgi:hypothetical protein
MATIDYASKVHKSLEIDFDKIFNIQKETFVLYDGYEDYLIDSLTDDFSYNMNWFLERIGIPSSTAYEFCSDEDAMYNADSYYYEYLENKEDIVKEFNKK